MHPFHFILHCKASVSFGKRSFFSCTKSSKFCEKLIIVFNIFSFILETFSHLLSFWWFKDYNKRFKVQCKTNIVRTSFLRSPDLISRDAHKLKKRTLKNIFLLNSFHFSVYLELKKVDRDHFDKSFYHSKAVKWKT